MNITELNTALLQVREAIAERDRLSRELDRVERSLKEERARLGEFTTSLQKENEDVLKLEQTSLVGLFYAILGSKENRLDQERMELLAARLKYDNSQRRVSNLDHDAEELRFRMNRLGSQRNLRERYDALLSDKEQLLKEQDRPETHRLMDLAEELSKGTAEERELKEAIQAGERAQAGLARVLDALVSASNWGTWELLGGGMITDMVKHSKLDEANQAVHQVQPLLERFERELADVGAVSGMQVDTGGLVGFADIFLDGLLVDLLMQSRINDSLEAAHRMNRQVSDLLARLTRQHTRVSGSVQQMESERRGLLEQI